MEALFSPFFLIAGIGLVIAIGLIVAAFRVRSRIAKAGLVFLTLVALAPAGFVVDAFFSELLDARFRTYKSFYQDIQPGMTRAEVFATLGRRYPKSGPRQSPEVMADEPDKLGFFMNAEGSREPNCEGIFLKMENGRVVKKEYSPD